ncbi:hypothetical protein HHL16_24330 [Pseudoflavitalea sp. G-6-1-2]|uniref:SIR2 family protein n=1 Tax=Pseudoflavitalea sp. G-6-1-2 TaxID=2728841 RepID=UPI00146D6E5C|nr:SIR2 family protein [Pseudoflavitalea sp. G-6-1-2]NML24027.1 hypothetical protein [Pseudoflavitalea sp. G-6-1-2]
MEYELPYDAFLRTLKQNTDTSHVVLLGAGASISSGIQSAADCIWEWKRDIFLTHNTHLPSEYKEYKSDTVQRSIQNWLDNQGGYPIEGAINEYSFYAEKAYPIDDIRRKYFENICRNKIPNTGYMILSLLAKVGMVRTVFTTNFDDLVEKAAYLSNITPFAVSLSNPQEIHRPESNDHVLTVALHGDFKYGPLKNTAQELDAQHEVFTQALTDHLKNKHLIICGYSGRDKALMTALKTAYEAPGSGMVFWCGYGSYMNNDVKEFLDHARTHGRSAFYVATEGFDITMYQAAMTCFKGNAPYEVELEKIIRDRPDETRINTPFSITSGHYHNLLKSNLFPIIFPTEVFQFKTTHTNETDLWQFIKANALNSNIVAVPLKGVVYCFSTQTTIRQIFGSVILGNIQRTPVTYKEVKNGTQFRKLFLSAIIQSICSKYSLQTDGWSNIYLPQTKNQKILNGVTYDVYDAFELSLFFDVNAFGAKPYAYISVKPSFYLPTDVKVSKEVRLALGKEHHQKIMGTRPNVGYSNQIEVFRNAIFPNDKSISLEFPNEQASDFKFQLGANPMLVAITSQQGGYVINFPQDFNSKAIVHHGVQYREPLMQFFDRTTARMEPDFHPMRGLIKHGPYDFPLNGNLYDAEVNLGIICPLGFETQLFNFLNRLNRPQPSGTYNPDYLIDYPGFNAAYAVPLNIADPKSDLWQTIVDPSGNDHLTTARDLAEKIKKSLNQFDGISKRHVVVIFIPEKYEPYTRVETDTEVFNLHDYIKAYAAQKNLATQFLREDTFIDNLFCQVNWWLSLSFYVKSQRTPWVLQGLDQHTAFVGIGYSVKRKEKNSHVALGCSHIYNAYGQGLKYRLTKVEDCEFDRKNNPYLSYSEAYKFGNMIRDLFLTSSGQIPKRVVVHKRTHFKEAEIKGITDSLRKSGITLIDLVEVNFEGDARFILQNIYQQSITPNFFPLHRGSCFVLDRTSALLWTHGVAPSVKDEVKRSYFLGGKSIPVPLKVIKHYGSSNIDTIATEILGLTKVNWNSFDMYAKLPATLQSSNEIARIAWLLNRFEGKNYDYRHFM